MTPDHTITLDVERITTTRHLLQGGLVVDVVHPIGPSNHRVADVALKWAKEQGVADPRVSASTALQTPPTTQLTIT